MRGAAITTEPRQPNTIDAFFRPSATSHNNSSHESSTGIPAGVATASIPNGTRPVSVTLLTAAQAAVAAAAVQKAATVLASRAFTARLQVNLVFLHTLGFCHLQGSVCAIPIDLQAASLVPAAVSAASHASCRSALVESLQ